MSLPELPTDDATLREVVDDPAPLRERAAQLAGARDAAGLGELTWTLRVLGRLGEAEDAGRRAVSAAGAAGHPRAVAAARLRLGHVLHWQGRHADAEEQFAIALSEAEQVGDERLRALALQHRGRSRFDEGRAADAERDFTAALQIRRRVGAPAAEVAACEQAVTAAMRRLLSGSAPR
jgi:tetratricopeptide (TPR) repeat protein